MCRRKAEAHVGKFPYSLEKLSRWLCFCLATNCPKVLIKFGSLFKSGNGFQGHLYTSTQSVNGLGKMALLMYATNHFFFPPVTAH